MITFRGILVPGSGVRGFRRCLLTVLTSKNKSINSSDDSMFEAYGWSIPFLRSGSKTFYCFNKKDFY